MTIDVNLVEIVYTDTILTIVYTIIMNVCMVFVPVVRYNVEQL